MKSTLLAIFFLTLAQIKSNPIVHTSRVNTLKKDAQKAYEQKDFKKAVTNYKILVDSMRLEDENLKLNYGHASYESGDTASAKGIYRDLSNASNKEIASIANQQLGVMSGEQNIEESLGYFKNALRKNPANEDARYNYEALKKKLAQQQSQQEKNEQIKPSEFAKALKKKAEEMVSQNLYVDAFHLMQQGLQKDQTVQAFSDFIGRLKNVAEVSQ